MAVTAQQIAELAGVSRGTVDRALHNRGRVNPEVAARIQRIAEELGYKPNLVGQALVRTKRDFKIGAILQSVETPTMQIVLEGLRRAADELRSSGVELIVRELRGLDEELVLENIEELTSQGIQGLAISPNNTAELRQCINGLYEQGIPVITLNSDVPGSKRICFIGMDNYRAGQTAAGLRDNPKFCVTAKSGANRVKFIMGGRRIKRLPPCLQHNANGTGCQGGAIISPQPSI